MWKAYRNPIAGLLVAAAVAVWFHNFSAPPATSGWQAKKNANLLGFEAGCNGRDPDRCPHAEGSDLRNPWLVGYEEGRLARARGIRAE